MSMKDTLNSKGSLKTAMKTEIDKAKVKGETKKSRLLEVYKVINASRRGK